MKLSSSEKSVLNKAVIIASIVLLIIFWQFIAPIVTALIFAVIFVPIYQWLHKKTKRNGLSQFLTVMLSIFAIIIPLILVVWISVDQVQNMINDITRLLDNGDTTLSEDKILQGLNDVLSTVTNDRVQISLDQFESAILTAARTIGETALNFMTNTVSSVPKLVTNIIIFFYVFIGLLGNYKKVLNYLRKLNPLGDEVSTMYLERAKVMTNSMVKGQFVVAIAQGIIGAISLHIAGIDYFTFFALLLSVLSIVPLGGGILTIPIGVVMILLGNIPGGLIVLLTHFIIVTNIDNYIRPKLVPEELSLHPALVMISVFSGLALFGFLGIVAGPVILILALTTQQIYIKATAKK